MVSKHPISPRLKKTVLACLVLGFAFTSVAQKFNFEQFTYVQASGKVPDYFHTPVVKHQEGFKLLLEQGKDEKAQKLVLSRINQGHYSILNMFESGEILFGDPLTKYVNGVADVIVKSNPWLPKNMQFYVTRAPHVNAGCYAMGVILVNVGLIAQVRSEAELAMVLCHEISHYTKRHNILSSYDYFDESQKKKSRKQTYVTYMQGKIDRAFNRSKEHELEADSAGLLLFKNTGYEAEAAISMFHMLHTCDNSYGTLPLDLDFFTLDGIKLPQNFWLDEIKVSAPFQEYNDRYYTHPNAGVRLEHATRQCKGLGFLAGGEKYKSVTESEFSNIQDLARFEQLRSMLATRQYGDVIYNSYVLLKKYPSNKYLEINIAKAFYGLARYKNYDSYSDVARSYTQVEGESQRMHYMLKQFNRKQLNAYALKLVLNTSAKYPTEKILDSLKSDLVKDMVVVNEVHLQTFDYPGTKKDELYIKLLEKDVKDPGLGKMFASGYALLEKKKADDVMSAADREKEKEAKEKALKKFGPGIKAEKILVESPSVAHMDKEGELLLEESETLRINVKTALQDAASKTSITCSPVRYEARDDAAAYNRLALLNECIGEFIAHGNKRIRPVVADFVWPIANDCKTPLLYFTSCSYDQATRKHKISSALYNLNSCRVMHHNTQYEAGEPSLKDLQAFILEDFETIKR